MLTGGSVAMVTGGSVAIVTGRMMGRVSREVPLLRIQLGLASVASVIPA